MRCPIRTESERKIVLKIKFDMIGIFASDLNKMVRFYNEVIGIEIDWDGQGPYAEFSHDGIRFSMFERRLLPDLLGRTPGFPEGTNGTFELALNVGDPAKVDELYTRLIEQGAEAIYPPRDEPWKMRSAMIADPEGNMIEIASDFWD